MIILDVEKYCHDCPCFEPEKIDMSSLDGSHFVIGCVHSVECFNIKSHLEKSIKE